MMADERRDKAGELLEIVDRYTGFGTVVICGSGFRFVCSIDDLRDAMRRRERAATEETEVRR